RVDVGNKRLGALAEAQLHALELGLRHEEIAELFEQLIQFGGLAIELDAAGVAEKVVEDFAQAGRLLVNGVEAVDQPAVGGIFREQILAQKLEIELDGREWVLDLVRKPAGERADLGEPLGLDGAAFPYLQA